MEFKQGNTSLEPSINHYLTKQNTNSFDTDIPKQIVKQRQTHHQEPQVIKLKDP